MDPNENLFRSFLYDYLKKKGLSRTAEIFRNEAQVTEQTLPELDQEPHRFLYDFWILFCDKYKSSQFIVQPSHTLVDYQDPNVGAVMNTASQMIRGGYSIRCIDSLLTEDEETLLSCDISSDGKIVAFGGLGRKPILWDLDEDTYLITTEAHSSAIFEVRFRPQSTQFATSSADKTVKLWDTELAESVVFTFVGHQRIIQSLDFNPSGEILCSSDKCELKIWDINQRVMIRSSKTGGSHVRFQPGSGKFLAVAKRKDITIIDSDTLQFVNKLQGHVKDINSICWDVTGKMIASVSEDYVRVWLPFEVDRDKQCIHAYPSDGNRFHSVIFHPRYHSVLVIGGYQWLELWILQDGGRHRHSEYASELRITGLAATTGEGHFIIASTSNDAFVKLWQ